MNKATLTLTSADIALLSPATQNELKKLLFVRFDHEAQAPGEQREPTNKSADEEDGPADLTVALCRKLMAAPIHEKTLAALRVIAESDTPEFHLAAAVAAAPGADRINDLRGTWSGLTRRTRKILNDDDVDLIWWEGDAILDEEDNYVDHLGRVSPLTHASLKTAMGIRS